MQAWLKRESSFFQTASHGNIILCRVVYLYNNLHFGTSHQNSHDVDSTFQCEQCLKTRLAFQAKSTKGPKEWAEPSRTRFDGRWPVPNSFEPKRRIPMLGAAKNRHRFKARTTSTLDSANHMPYYKLS